jgi:PBP1b-binding outer membrane lipoprotein LpoB
MKKMKKTALLFLLVSLLSGCAGTAAKYPLCSVLPGGAAGCPSQPSQKGN